jgi:predicted Zn-dependent protease
MRLRSLVPVLAALSLTAQQRDLGKGVNFYSKEKEAALGKVMAEDVRRQTTKLDNPEVQAYVERVGGRLAAHLPDTSLTFTFAVVSDDRGGPTHEPYALPGGYIFISSSLILGAQDEAEFAGTLAHAMVHVAARHSTRNATRGEIANLATIPLIYMGGWQIGDAARTLIPVGFLKFQREFELEADRVAVPTMAAAGYDPAALLRYVSRVQPESTGQVRVFDPMPTRDQRIAAIQGAIRKLDDFKRIQDTVRKAIPKPAE